MNQAPYDLLLRGGHVIDPATGWDGMTDTEDTEVIADRMLRPLFCVRAGRRYDAAAPILPLPVAA